MKPSTIGKLRAWWAYRQGLDGRLGGSAPYQVLQETGWARSVGGVGPYLTLFARAGNSREQVDAAVRNLEIHEIPAARGCTYVVPASDFALALSAARSFSGNEMNVARKLGVTDREIDQLCEAVLQALAQGALEPDSIRTSTGNASRSLGEEGKKKGLSTTLPLALGKLQVTGEIRRLPLNGRLDQQRYAYTLWHPNPLGGRSLPDEEVNRQLAERYFSWIGPATIDEFRWFSALSAKAAKAALQDLHLVPFDEERLISERDRESFEAFQIPKEARYTLVSGLDGISLLRRDLKSLTAEEDYGRTFVADKDAKSLSGMADLPSHAILDRGRLVGLWEFDPASNSIAWASFIPKSAALRMAVAKTEEWVRSELGDARSFSLDSPKSRAPRIQALRQAS